jgi:CubicO group peptidase (beta-lactamase class C family)
MLPERVERVRDVCAGWVKGGHTPTLAVCVARRGVIVLHEAWGKLRTGDDSPPVPPDAIFPVASIAKPITATLVLSLAEEGRLGLNRLAVEYLPELCGEGTGEIAVHQLLTHTSGFDNLQLLPFFLGRLEQSIELPPCPPGQHPVIHEGLELLWPAPLATPPGSRMSYTNHSYELLGEIVRRVSGRPLDDLARERVFGPLGMADSSFVVPEAARPRVVERPPAPEPPIPRRFAPGPGSREWQDTPSAAAGLASTARDLAALGQAFLDGGRYGAARILSRPTVREMTRNQIPGIRLQFGTHDLEASYGYGWFVKTNEKFIRVNGGLPAPGSFGHTGGGGSKLWIDPENEIVGAYLEVTLHNFEEILPLWNGDLFEDAVTAAVAD